MNKLNISEKNKGVFFIILSAFCFGMMNVLIRLSGDLPVYEKAFFRNLVAFFFALIILKQQNIDFKVSKSNLKNLILRSSFGTIGIFCNFYAVDHLLVSDASMLNKLSPFFVIIFSFLLLKEKVKPTQAILVATAFIGALFVIKPGVVGMDFIPALLGTCGGMCAGIAYTFVRKLGNNGVKGPFIVFFFSGFSCIASVPFMFYQFVPMNLTQIITLLFTGLAASGGQFFITAAYTHAPASEISVYDYSQILFVTVISFFLYGEIPDTYSFIGYGIILFASIMMFLYNNNKLKFLKEKN